MSYTVRSCVRTLGLSAASVLASLVPVSLASGQDLGNFQIFQTGFDEPIFLGSPPGEPERLLVAEITGRVRVIENGVLLPTPFLDIRSRMRLNHGLIGIAFPPDYATSRRFYVNYTPEETIEPRIVRMATSKNPNVANTAEEILLQTGPGGGDHNAGWMDFGKDGYLWIARGDIGGDPQNPNDYQGKMLRIDVSPRKGYTIPPDNPFVGAGGREEVVAMGLRNPWRNAFDPLTGDLYIADVGQFGAEEVNFIAADSALGQNFGWPCMEGLGCYDGCNCNIPGFTNAAYVMGRQDASSVIGGVVYRGSAIPRWRGRFFFADHWYRRLASLRVVDGQGVDVQQHYDGLIETIPFERNDFTIAFGTDADGEIYVLERTGRILKIVPEYAPADWNLDGLVNSSDFFDYLVDFFENNADMTGDNRTGSPDFFEFLRYFFTS